MPLYNPPSGAADGVNIVAAGTQTAQTTGTVVFSNSNNVTFGMSNSSVVTATVTVASTQGSINLSAGTTSNLASAFTFSNSNGLAFGLNAGTITGSYTVPTVSSWTASDSATSLTIGRLAFTNANGVTLTLSTTTGGSATLVGAHNGITTGRASNDGVGLNTAQTNVTWTVNSAGLSLNAGGYAGTGTSATNASITLDTNGLAISVAAPGAAAENNWVHLTGNTAGNTTASGSTIVFSGGNNITVSGTNGSVIVFSAAAGGGGGIAAGVSTGGNTAGSTGTVSTGNFVLVGSNGITLSQSTGAAGSAATVTIAGDPPMSVWRPFMFNPILAGTAQANSLVSIAPILLEDRVVASNVRFAASFNVASAANNSSAFIDLSVSGVWYTRNASSLSSVFSFSNTMTATWSSNATGTVTGVHAITATFPATTFSQGEWFLALHVSTTNTATGGAATTALARTLSMILGLNLNSANNLLKPWAGQSNASIALLGGAGLISTGVTRASIGFADYTVTGTRGLLAPVYMELRNATWVE